ncbi:MAG: DUF1559 domain-containing protein [Planctomycetes bacterium]|nr:DUF1559 domain-containing protein [Planctomycetota bacterium]
MNNSKKRAFTLVELLVVIAIIGTLVGLLLPAVQSSREAARSNTCRNNLTQLHRAMAGYELSFQHYPGYVDTVGLEGANQERASWVVMLFPFMEQASLWDQWSKGIPEFAELELLICPSNPPDVVGEPSLAYVANAGYINNEDDRKICDADIGLKENIANGVFFDRTRGLGPNDIRDVEPPNPTEYAPDPVFKVTLAHLQSAGDGTTKTLMLTENLNAVNWAYKGGDISAPDRKYNFGFCWEQPYTVANAVANSGSSADPDQDPQFRLINGKKREGLLSISAMKYNHGFPSSHHASAVNVAFAGGQIRLLRDNISPLVYAQLMTSNRNQSDLFINRDGNTVYDKDLKQPDDDQY